MSSGTSITTGTPEVRESEVEQPGGQPERSAASAAAPVASAAESGRAALYADWWKIWLPIPLILLLLDVSFNSYFWRIPKLSGTADDYSYQFLYDLHHLQTTPPQGVRVLAFGSSVTSAFDPYQIGSLLDVAYPEDTIEVRRILRPGSKPSDYHLLWQTELEDIDADVVVSVFNLVDFINPTFEQSLKPGIRYILPPWETLMARYELIPRFSEKLEMLLASVSNLYRYRKPIRSAIRDHAKLMRSWWRGGGELPYGVYADGFTKPRFGVPATDSLEYRVEPAWIEQRGRAKVRFRVGTRQVVREHREPGWYRVDFPEAVRSGGLIDVEVESGWSPRAASADDTRLLGVRLRTHPGGNTAKRRPPLRYPPVAASDIKPFIRMGKATGAEYAEEWGRALEADNDFGHRYRLYRDAKLERSEQRFEPTQEFAELRAMVLEVAARGHRVVMVNTPENPLLSQVVRSDFYRDYLSFFEAIAASDPRITFIDLHNQLPPEDLNDWHHLNFVGQLKLGTVLAERLRPVVGGVLDDRNRVKENVALGSPAERTEG